MDNRLSELIEKLFNTHSLEIDEYEYLITHRTKRSAQMLCEKAGLLREAAYGKTVFIRGLIEVSSYCKNDCLYCGLRRSNHSCERYRLTREDILECCESGYALGFRTFVLQGGEDPKFTDDFICDTVREIKNRYPDCAVTLSLGEKDYASYKRFFAAGAARYLLRHETANAEHYAKLHPEDMTLKNRMECLYDLKEIGFQVGCGFMVGSPYQTDKMLAQDLKFIEEFKPDMCGIGPFVPHSATPFRDIPHGSAELPCYLLSIIRIIHPDILLPSTTALGTILDGGREMGILSGANVVMPNLSPKAVRKKYLLYNNKLSDGDEAAESLENLKKRIATMGYEIVTARGDRKDFYSGNLQSQIT